MSKAKARLIKANKIKTKWVSGKGERETNQNCGDFFSHTVKKFGKIVLLWEMSYFYFFKKTILCSIEETLNK